MIDFTSFDSHVGRVSTMDYHHGLRLTGGLTSCKWVCVLHECAVMPHEHSVTVHEHAHTVRRITYYICYGMKQVPLNCVHVCGE